MWTGTWLCQSVRANIIILHVKKYGMKTKISVSLKIHQEKVDPVVYRCFVSEIQAHQVFFCVWAHSVRFQPSGCWKRIPRVGTLLMSGVNDFGKSASNLTIFAARSQRFWLFAVNDSAVCTSWFSVFIKIVETDCWIWWLRSLTVWLSITRCLGSDWSAFVRANAMFPFFCFVTDRTDNAAREKRRSLCEDFPSKSGIQQHDGVIQRFLSSKFVFIPTMFIQIANVWLQIATSIKNFEDSIPDWYRTRGASSSNWLQKEFAQSIVSTTFQLRYWKAKWWKSWICRGVLSGIMARIFTLRMDAPNSLCLEHALIT